MPRILLVSRTLPHPPTTGGQQRTYLLHRALSEIAEVDFLAVRGRESVPADVHQALEQNGVAVTWSAPLPRGNYWPWKAVRRLSPDMVDRLAHNLGRREVDYWPDPRVEQALKALRARHAYDLIVGRPMHHIALCGALESGIPVVIDVDDFDPQVYRSWLETPGLHLWKRIIIRHHLRQLERIVPRIVERAAHLWIASPSDRPLIPHSRVSLLPNIPFRKAAFCGGATYVGKEEKGERVLFLGAMSYRVNRDGVDHFARRIWPQVKEARPQAILRICGSGFTEALKKRWGSVPGVEPVGFVEDLETAYRQSLFTVVPLFEGGGTKIKVLESLMYGRTAVITAHAQRGYEDDLRHEESLLVGTNDAELATYCVRLLTDSSLRKRLARHGQRQIRERYSYARFRDVVARTVEQCCGAGPREV